MKEINLDNKTLKTEIWNCDRWERSERSNDFNCTVSEFEDNTEKQKLYKDVITCVNTFCTRIKAIQGLLKQHLEFIEQYFEKFDGSSSGCPNLFQEIITCIQETEAIENFNQLLKFKNQEKAFQLYLADLDDENLKPSLSDNYLIKK